MSGSIEQFHKETEVIMQLLSEIHDICQNNNIKYYLADDLFLLAYEQLKEEEDNVEDTDDEKEEERIEQTPVIQAFSDDREDTTDLPRSDIDIRGGMIYMHPDDFLRFTKAVGKDERQNRALEWMGTNPVFPGLYARYVDTSTVYYTALRLCTEKQLGMFITINIIRPKDASTSRDRLKERIWRDWAMGLQPIRKKIKYSFAMLDMKSSVQGKERVARRYAEKLLNHYAALREKNGSKGDVWILKDTKIRPYLYPASLFSEDATAKLGDKSFITVKDQKTYSLTARRRNVSIKDNIISFCDTEISFKDIDLESFKEQATSFIRFNQNFIQNPEIRGNRRKWKGLLRTLSRSYYRYYYGTQLLDHIDEYEEMIRSGKTKELKEELDPYKGAILNLGGVYLSDRMSKVMSDLYGDTIARKLQDRPEVFDEGIKIYDYNGNYQRTIGGRDV